jgi:hypothetical protein
LQTAEILLVLATDRSIHRPWVWFETGAGWRSQIKTIPCCLGVTRKNELPAPFSQYQGLNIDDDKDLRNLFQEISRALELTNQDVDTQPVIAECQRLERLASAAVKSVLSATELERRLESTNVSAKIDHGNASNL